MIEKNQFTDPNAHVGAKERKIAAYISLVIGVILFSAKLYGFRITGSHAVLSDALESIVNVISAVIALVVVIIASQPADQNHPYGHGKAESFSAVFEGGAICVAGVLIIIESLTALVDGVQLSQLNQGLMIVLGAGIVNLLLGLYLRRVGRGLRSQALEASGIHVLSDFWTSIGVVAGLLAVKLTGWVWLDPIVAIIVGINLSLSGFRTFWRSSSELMDAENAQLIQLLCKLFEKHVYPGIIRIHHTRIMRSGRYHHVDLHLVVPEFWSIEKGHEESYFFEAKVLKDYPVDGELNFHLDPCRKAYCRVCDLSDCQVRREEFQQRIPFSLEELTSPIEPAEYE